MNYAQTVTEFLAKPENLPIALEVAQHVEKAKDHLQIQFWELYYADMERRLRESKQAGRWKVAFIRPDDHLLDGYQCCLLRFDVGNTQSIQLRVGFQAGASAGQSHCFYGLNWSRKDGSSDPKVIGDLLQALSARSIPVNTTPWWLTSTRLKYSLREDQFLIRCANEPEPVVREIGDIVWSLFIQMREPLEAANEAFAKQNP